MAKRWDQALRWLIRINPQAFVNLLVPNAHFVKVHSTVVESERLEVDALLEVSVNNARGLLHIEFQTYNDATIGHRLMRYNMLTRFQYHLPVLSCVIWLLKDGDVPQSPLQVDFLGLVDVIMFRYLSVELAQLSPETFLESKQLGLLPLVSLTQGGTDRAVIQQIFREIQSLQDIEEKDRQDAEFIAFTLASLILQRTSVQDIEWLRRRFRTMYDILKESPIYQEVLQEGRLEGIQEGRLLALRDMLFAFLQARSPRLLDLARTQIEQINDPAVLKNVSTRIVLSQTEEQIQHYLLNWHDTDNGKTS